MAFTGKASYDGGATWLEAHEDISNLIGNISPSEITLLDALGDPIRPAMAVNHEWLEDSLNPFTDALNDGTDIDDADTAIVVDDGSKFRARDLIQFAGSAEIIFVTSVSTNTLTCVRGYSGTTGEAVVDNTVVTIIASPALEGEDARADRSTTRTRVTNQTQIFTETVEVSGTQEAVNLVGTSSEVGLQTENRLKELLMQLERAVIRGGVPATVTQGSGTVARTMDGIRSFITSNALTANSGVLAGSGVTFTEDMLNTALRNAWDNSGITPDLMVLGGFQKRQFNGFKGATTTTREDTRAGSMAAFYDSDFGVVKAVLNRHIPNDSVALISSSHVKVMPLRGRSFFRKQLAETGDAKKHEIIGEYTVELNNQAHATWIDTLAVS